MKLAILTCPFEPPKPKTKHKVGGWVAGWGGLQGGLMGDGGALAAASRCRWLSFSACSRVFSLHAAAIALCCRCQRKLRPLPT